MQCDVCSNTFDEDSGYLLTTFEVLKSVPYWRIFWNNLLSTRNNKLLEDEEVAIIAMRWASNNKPWMVCEGCSSMFSINRSQAKKYAENWRLTGQPSTGMALCRIEEGNRVKVIDDDKFKAAIDAAIYAYVKYNVSSSRKWWQFWKSKEAQPIQEFKSDKSNAYNKQSKDYTHKIKKCLNCNTEITGGQLKCPACGSDHYIWE